MATLNGLTSSTATHRATRTTSKLSLASSLSRLSSVSSLATQQTRFQTTRQHDDNNDNDVSDHDMSRQTIDLVDTSDNDDAMHGVVIQQGDPTRSTTSTTSINTLAAAACSTTSNPRTKATTLASMNDDSDGDAVDGKAVNVVVCLRVRPTRNNSLTSNGIYEFDPTTASMTLSANHPTILKRASMKSTTTTTRNHSDEYEFRFDKLHLPPVATDVLYDDKIRPIVRATMNGFNGTVFAYGQTASGKTHTMMGSDVEPGIIPLAIDEVFKFIHQQDIDREFSLRVSFLEIYNETIRDLLATTTPTTTKSLEVVGEDGIVKGLEEKPVSMPSEVLNLLRQGDVRRRVGATDWNERSSRSHSVFVVTIESMRKDGQGLARVSKLNLIDLAGSESATGQDERRKEGAYINKSLLTLSTVISKLSEARPNGPIQHIPYRDSKLTRLLQPALSGKSRIAIVCTISPDEQQSTETLSTLKFAKRAKMVVTKAERGVLMTDAMMLRQYQQQVALLQAQIDQRQQRSTTPDEHNELLTKQLTEASAKMDEYQNRSKKAEEELARKDLELALLRERLQHAQSFILDGPRLEANARRTSVGIVTSSPMHLGRGRPPRSGDGDDANDDTMTRSSSWQRDLDGLLSPSRRGAHMLNQRGKRVVSDMSSLGHGTPRNGVVQTMRSVASGEIKEWTKEAELEKALSQTRDQAQRISDLEQQLEELQTRLNTSQSENSLTREELDKSNKIVMDSRDKIRLIEKDFNGMRDKASKVEELTEQIKELERVKHDIQDELEQTRTNLLNIQVELQQTKESNQVEVNDLTRQLVDSKEQQRTLETQLEAKDTLVTTFENQLCQVRDELCTKEALIKSDTRDETIAALERQVDKVVKERDDKIRSFEREMSSVKHELEAIIATRDSLINSARDEANLANQERNVAQQESKDARIRIAELEDVTKIERERHDLAIELSQREHEAALKALKADFERIKIELESKESKAKHLQRLVEANNKRDADQRQYMSNQRAGTDALQARLETLRGRHASAITTGSASSSLSKTSNGRDEAISTLETRNNVLSTRVEELERQLEKQIARPSTPDFVLKEQAETLQAVVDEQKRAIGEVEKVADDWKQRYLAAQSMLDNLLNAGHGDDALGAAISQPSTARSSLSDIGNSLGSSYRRPYHVARTSSTSTTSGSVNNSVGKGLPGSPLIYTRDQPPPLPCSPHNKDKERTKRRVTTTHDIERLKEVRGVSHARELFDSPSGGSVSSSMMQEGITSLRSPTKVRAHKSSYE
ncbi:Kinesin-like protein kip2 [Microbotryomycetes sp. JL221]|nr:Kinesin-like protein kip2 [Microbotryomycetes sp. JL221]